MVICDSDENGVCRTCGLSLGKNARLCQAKQPPMEPVSETPFMFPPPVRSARCELCSEARGGTWCRPVYEMLRMASVYGGGCCGGDGVPKPAEIEMFIRNVETGLAKCPKEDA